MTDRITAYLVTLETPTREDDAEAVLTALRQIRGVAAVKPVVREMLAEQAAITRRDRAWTEALWALASDGPALITGEER
jgi:hypothetical protein